MLEEMLGDFKMRTRATLEAKQQRSRLRSILRLSGLVAAIIAVGTGWWAGVGSANGSPIVIWAASLASAGLILVATGFARRSAILSGIGMVLVGVCAPTGFGYLANLVALVCGIALLLRRIFRH